MYAEIELTEDIKNFLKETESYNETFDEIKELLFTNEMLSEHYSITEILKATMQFQEIKRNAYHKALHNQKLNYIEGMLIERLLTKYNGLELVSVNEHLKIIQESCIDISDDSKISKLLAFISKKVRGNNAN